MNVSIVTFPETKVAAINHLGPPQEEHSTLLKLVQWKIENQFLDQSIHRHYGLHYTDSRKIDPKEHQVEFCLSISEKIESNTHGVYEKTIPNLRCALARDVGARFDNQAALFLYDNWLPKSGETMADYPIIFHYVNVGPNIQSHEAITDVYLPLK
jgi:AraC family transcriptional regulator